MAPAGIGPGGPRVALFDRELWRRGSGLKLDSEAFLTCSACGVEGAHELLYLSEHLCASRCANCGKTHVFTGHIYADYAKDLAGRTAGLTGRVFGDVLKRPTSVFGYPFKVAAKPFQLVKEVTQLTAFERGRHARTPGLRS
jgi:hypothetical protein